MAVGLVMKESDPPPPLLAFILQKELAPNLRLLEIGTTDEQNHAIDFIEAFANFGSDYVIQNPNDFASNLAFVTFCGVVQAQIEHRLQAKESAAIHHRLMPLRRSLEIPFVDKYDFWVSYDHPNFSPAFRLETALSSHEMQLHLHGLKTGLAEHEARALKHIYDIAERAIEHLASKDSTASEEVVFAAFCENTSLAISGIIGHCRTPELTMAAGDTYILLKDFLVRRNVGQFNQAVGLE